MRSRHLVLFHSALGLTPGVRSFADVLQADGFVVVTPDLYDGETFRSLDDGVKKRNALGVPELLRRAADAVEALPADVVYAGFSMGAAAAQSLVVSKPGARGAVLMHGAVPLELLGVDAWPNVPTQVHVAEADPWVDRAQLDGFVAAARAERFEYPGGAHLFADESGTEYEPDNAAKLVERVRAFVKRVA